MSVMGASGAAAMGAMGTEGNDEFAQSVQKRLKSLRVIGRLCSIAGTLLLSAVAVFALVVTVGPRILGLQAYAMVSGSMEPTYPTGSLVYAEPVRAEDLSEGDVAVFWRNDEVVIHRVEENHPEDRQMITRGDANEGIDAHPALYENVVGRALYQVPNLGFFLMALSSLPGKLVLGWIVMMGVAFAIVGTAIASLTKP